jgi:hypothetical protein
MLYKMIINIYLNINKFNYFLAADLEAFVANVSAI